MKKVLRLVNVQLWAMLTGMFALGENKKKKTRALYFGFILFIISISLLSFFYAYMIGTGLKLYDSISHLPSIYMAMASIMVLFATVYKVKGTIFGFKDYDMLMSLPVSNSKIVASRIILLYSVNFVFVLIIMLPMMAAYGILVRPELQFYIYSVLTVFFIPLIPIIIASVLGTILTYISMRFRNSHIIYMVFAFLLLLTFIIMPFFLMDSDEALVEISKAISDRINAIYPLAMLYSKAVLDYNLLSVIIFVTISVVAFSLYSLGVGKIFIKINTVIMTGRYKADYKLGDLKKSSPLMALYRKELKRYFTSSVYVINTGFGVVILLLASIVLPFVDLNALAADMQITGIIQNIIPIFITFCIATSCTTMASVSIEGKNLWIIKSLPISTFKIFLSKILVNLTILAPTVFASILLGITLRLPLINGLLVVFAAVSYSIFISLYGLVINLSFPNLSWTTEAVIVKQSTASMISVFSGIAITAIQFALLTVIGNFILSNLIFLCLLWLLNILLYKRLMGTGIRQFEKL